MISPIRAIRPFLRTSFILTLEHALSRLLPTENFVLAKLPDEEKPTISVSTLGRTNIATYVAYNRTMFESWRIPREILPDRKLVRPD
jgi:hypothetical protein